ncbi:MAG TPA: agmatine deiminase family protein [Thermodesulfobacteriota bacterium]|nr:agmatine deiminase family protein [Thermodesulfobacteriota bacterium]
MKLRLPAEWEKHEATWLAWPKRREDWPGKYSSIKWVYADIIKAISYSETLNLIVDSEQAEQKVRAILKKSSVDLNRIKFYHINTDRSWIRDYGPFFVRLQNKINALSFKFNGWAKYSQWKNDNKVASHITSNLNIESIRAEYYNKEIILEGGSIDVNGKGTLITTRQCLLSSSKQVRNRGLSKEDYEQIFNNYFGITNTIWLNEGIAGDDTNGHIDDICRFVNTDTVVACHESNPDDTNYKYLKENLEILGESRLEDGSKINVIKLPMPEPKYFDGYRLPASYANFYITNKCVLVPTYNDTNDYKALGILGELFSDRKVIGINCVDLIWGLGAIHCMTKEQFAQS